jgi:hypothetical protein
MTALIGYDNDCEIFGLFVYWDNSGYAECWLIETNPENYN